MNEANFALAAEIIPETYIKIASQARKQRENIIKNLLSHVSTTFVVTIQIFASNSDQKLFSFQINLTLWSMLLTVP